MKLFTRIGIASLACLLALTLGLVGCQERDPHSLGSLSDSDYTIPPTVNPGLSPETTVGDVASVSRKVIFSYGYQLETTSMNTTLSTLESAVLASGGYIQNASYSGRNNANQYNSATLICRVPVASVGAFRNTIEAAGQVRSKTEQGTDVTDEYFDVEARLTVLNAQEGRLLELLEHSGTLSDLLEIERELARVRTEIERLTGTLAKYDNLVDLATFTINIYNVNEYSPTSDESFLARLGRSVLESLGIALYVLQGILIFLVYAFPYLLITGLIVFIVIRVRRRRKEPDERKTRDRGASQRQRMAPPMTSAYGTPPSTPSAPSMTPPHDIP